MHLIIISSSYSSQHNVYISHDEQSNSFSTYIDDEIRSAEDNQPYVLEELQPDLIIEDQEEVENMEFFNL
jgi:hypothetical protein